MRRGMLDTRDSQYSWVISVTQTSLIACLRFSALDGCLYATLSFIIVHMFSIWLASRLFAGHSSTEILFFFRNWLATFDRWQGAPSCITIVQPWTSMCSFSLSLSDSTHFWSIHSGVRRNELQTSSVTERHYTPNHSTRRVFHCGYNTFLVETLTQWPPNVHVAMYILLHGLFVRKQHFVSTQRESSLVFFTTGVRSGFRACLWDCSRHSLLGDLEALLELIAVPF